MPILSPTPISGTVAWLGIVRGGAGIRAEAVPEVAATWEGFAGDTHASLTRPSCSRVTAQYPKGTEIRNTRQVSILSTEELAAIAAAMGLPALDPVLLGASLVLTGIPDLTLLPPSSRLVFPSGASLVVDMENAPCTLPAREIEALHPGFGARFKPAAKHRRGVTGWVERPGRITLGDKAALHIPPQRLWPHAG